MKHSRFAKIKKWLHAHPTAVYALVGLVLIIAAGITAAAILFQPPKKIDSSPISTTKKPEKTHYYSALNGVEVSSKSKTTKPVTAIMIENSLAARPQSGLKDAEVVYEAIAEGGITRFMAIYQQHKPKLIGPVRSVRQYYLDWVTPYDASIAHVGGSAGALKTVRNGKYRDLDQFFNAGTYWRSTDRYAPHNVYTSFKKLDALNKTKKYKTSHPKSIDRADIKQAKKLNASRVSVHISSADFDSSYIYSKKSKLYTRSEGGAAHKDREKGTIKPKVVVALYLDMHEVMQDGYREKAKTVGSGKAVIFQNGTATKVAWHKKSVSSQLTFTKDDKSFALARGQTWITALPNGEGRASWK